MAEDLERRGGRGGGGGGGENMKSKKHVKSKAAEDIIEAVKREKLGFSDKQLRPAVNALIETYGTDDAYKWITKDNFAVLVNFLLESPRKATDVSSSPLPSGENARKKHHNYQVPVKHSGNATESGLALLARDVVEQGCLHSTTPLISNATQKKHRRDEYLTDGSNKVKKVKLYSNYPARRPHTEHICKRLLEQNDGVSPSAAAQGELNGSSLIMNTLHSVPSAPSSAMSGEKECYPSKKMNWASKMHGSVGPLNGNASTDTKTSYQARAEDLRTSKSYSNAASSKKCDGINLKTCVVPAVKEKESSKRRSLHDEHAFEKQMSPACMSEKQLSATNSASVVEGHRLCPRDLRNSSDRQIGELKMASKEHWVGKFRHQNELGKDHKRKYTDKQTSLTEELSKTSKEHCTRKLKDHNESAFVVMERESDKQKSGNTDGDCVKRLISVTLMDGEQNSFMNCKNVNEENKTKSRDKRKGVNNKQSMPSKEFTSSLKEHHTRKVEGLSNEVILPSRKINNVMRSSGSNKPNKKNGIALENLLSPEKTKNVQDLLTIGDSLHGQKELTGEKVSGQFYYSILQELKIAASGWVKTANGWLKNDMSLEALHFFLECKKSLDSRKKKALALSNDNRQDYRLHEQGTPKTGEFARARRKKSISLSDQADVDGNLLSLDISRGLEKKKITCVNEYDDTFFPDDFVYITKSVITADAHVDLTLSRIGDMHCSCFGDCLMSTTPCKCTDDTRGEYAYDKTGVLIPRLATNFCFQDGKMTRADFITECTPICPCDMQCGNRVVQRGLKYKLQVFMTKEGKGWGVRTLERIVAHSFLFEYIGEIMTNMEQYYRNEEYKDKNIHTYQMLLDADYDMETKHFKDGLNDNEALTLDATRYGNVSRFVNHRCGDPNMFIRPVQIETRDTHYYHVAYFAAHDISEMEELTWDYGINFNDKHEVKGFHCLCGSSVCRDSKNKTH